ncbi:MAG: peptide ABC transporter substrate-binding protein [Parachlamydiales bacterium]|nr:peptide ABC transporter substrate-binding protein [Parachlamydiales bacterium]
MKVFFLCLLLLTGCRTAQKPNSQLNLAFNTHPTTTDPRKAADFISSTLVCMIYEGLTRCVPGGSVELALAERVEIKDNFYVFHLRNAYWSDGNPITAFDFERSWKEIIGGPSPCAFLFYSIKNAEKCARGEGGIEDVGVRARDARTLVVELERPTPYFYSLTAFPSFLAAPKEQEIVNGPYRIEKIVHNSEIVLKKNERFWNRENIHIDQIHISIVPDEMTALQMFERGDLDWIGASLSPLPPDAIEKLGDQIQYIPSAASTICTFNTQQFPFQNKNLRKAFSLSINRNEIEEAQIPARSILPPVFSCQSFYLHDPEGAVLYFEKGLQELGIERQDLEKLTLYFRSTQTEKRLAQTLQKQWKELFGITIQLAQLDFKTHAQKLQTKDYQISLASWIAQFEDPISILDRFKHSDHLKNYAGWENKAYIACLAASSISDNRIKLLAEAESILSDEAPITPIYHWSSPFLCSPRIKRMAASPCGGILFERFELN